MATSPPAPLFPPANDRASTTMRFWIQFLPQHGLPEGTFELVADGETVVQRGAAEVSDQGFRIPARMAAMPHAGSHPLLGAFQVDLDSAQESTGEIRGSLDPAIGAPRIDAQFPATGFFDLHLEITTAIGTLVTAAPIHVENQSIASLFPDSPYSHKEKAAILQLFLKGKLSQPLARLLAGYHSKHHSPTGPAGAPDRGECCCCSVEGEGQCGRFALEDADSRREELIFVSSPSAAHAAGPAFVTVTNEGPQPVTVFWDGPPPSFQDPAWSATLAPGNSLTVAALQAVKVVYAGGAVGPSLAAGCYVISWCCPER